MVSDGSALPWARGNTGAAGSEPIPAHPSAAEHPEGQGGTAHSARSPLPSYLQSLLLQESFAKLSESSGLVLSFG